MFQILLTKTDSALEVRFAVEVPFHPKNPPDGSGDGLKFIESKNIHHFLLATF